MSTSPRRRVPTKAPTLSTIEVMTDALLALLAQYPPGARYVGWAFCACRRCRASLYAVRTTANDELLLLFCTQCWWTCCDSDSAPGDPGTVLTCRYAVSPPGAFLAPHDATPTALYCHPAPKCPAERLSLRAPLVQVAYRADCTDGTTTQAPQQPSPGYSPPQRHSPRGPLPAPRHPPPIALLPAAQRPTTPITCAARPHTQLAQFLGRLPRTDAPATPPRMDSQNQRYPHHGPVSQPNRSPVHVPNC